MTSQGKDDRAVMLQRAIRLKRAAARSRAAELPRRPQDQPAYLAGMQRSLWLLYKIDPDSPAYNVASAFRFVGVVDLSRLQRSLDSVVARHRILRSTFTTRRDSVLQVVHPDASCEIQYVAADDGDALAAAVREARRPFDLETGPLVRLLLVQGKSSSRGLLVLLLHHILADERSLGFLWEELAAGYTGGSDDRADQPQYDDYAYWLARRDPEARRGDLDYWRERLRPLPEYLMLPFERSGPAETSARGRLLTAALGREVHNRVRSLAASVGTTPFIVFAFVFRLLLHRYTEGRDVAFATPASTRSHTATAGMIGYFLNPIVIRTPVDESVPVGRAVREFSGQMREALSHASVFFDALTEELSPPRQRDRHPVFQTMFVYQEVPPLPRLAGLTLEPVTLDLGESKFDLTLFVSEGERSLEIAVEYRADRFDEVWMQQLLGHYETLVRELADDLDRPTADVPMLAAAEETKLHAHAQGAAPAVAGSSLPRQILDRARDTPEATAVICGDQLWSYAELERAGSGIARGLAARGVRPGDRVGLLVDRSAWLIAAIVGCHWAGAAYVPLDPRYPSARNLDTLSDADVALVLSRPTLRDQLPDGSPSSMDVEWLAGDATEEAQLPEVQLEAPAYVLYTSGSTGRPKGVVVTHDNLRLSTGVRPQVYGTPPGRFLLVPSVTFDSSVAGLFWTLAQGGTLVVPTDDEATDPERLTQIVADHEVTSLLCVPSLYAHMLGLAQGRLAPLQTAIVAGENCPTGLVEEHFRVVPQARLFNEYGPTEATVWVTAQELRPEDAGRPVAIGGPIPGVRVELLDALGRRVPAGIPGQAWIAGPTLAEGYWQRPDLTDERFVTRDEGPLRGDRTYGTGDRLAWTSDGRLLFLGRVDEQIKLRGFRIEPGEIEAALRELPGVEEAVVVARAVSWLPAAGADPSSSQLVAFLETSGSVADLREQLARRLPEFMVPSRFVELAKLPRLPNGKVDRKGLGEMQLAPEARSAARRRVLSDREQSLVSLWEGLLGRAGIGPDDNFFRLGGHSLLVVEMARAIERDFGVALPPPEVFQNPTVRDLARRIEQRGGAATPPYAHLFPIQPRGSGNPFIFCVPHFFSEMVAARFRGERPVYGLRGVSLRQEGNRGRWRSMRDLGEELVQEICRRFPDETFIVAGYSFGATMAVEAVRQMEQRGLPVQRLYLIAPMPLDFYRVGPLRFQISDLRRPVDELSFGEVLQGFARGNNPLTRRPYRRLWRLVAIQPWRRLLLLAGKLRVLAGLPLTSGILYADVRVERFRLHAGYRPGILRTPTVIFNAREPGTDAAATWRPYFQGPLTVHETPDPHLDDASIEGAKELILRHLQELEAR